MRTGCADRGPFNPGRGRRMFACFFIFLFATAFHGHAQIKVQGGFLSDSLKIGEETAFYLSARYPSEATILFPDSSHNFFPFEYRYKKFFPTETAGGISRDSTVYYLSTFEIDPVIGLDLPAYVVSGQDCTEYRTSPDSMRIIQLVSEVPDSIPVDKLPLKLNVAYHPVNHQINYFILIMVAAGLGILALVVWIFFGRRISRYLTSRQLAKHHRAFILGFENIMSDLEKKYSPAATESALSLWKKYMERLEAKPYTKLTSRETVRILQDESLGNNLRAIDRAIYGHGQVVVEPLRNLKSVATVRFSKKLEEVKHGK